MWPIANAILHAKRAIFSVDGDNNVWCVYVYTFSCRYIHVFYSMNETTIRFFRNGLGSLSAGGKEFAWNSADCSQCMWKIWGVAQQQDCVHASSQPIQMEKFATQNTFIYAKHFTPTNVCYKHSHFNHIHLKKQNKKSKMRRHTLKMSAKLIKVSNSWIGCCWSIRFSGAQIAMENRANFSDSFAPAPRNLNRIYVRVIMPSHFFVHRWIAPFVPFWNVHRTMSFVLLDSGVISHI